MVNMFKNVEQNPAGYFQWRVILCLLLLVLVLHVQPATAIESENELTLKVAFTYNFAKFSEWPQTAFVNNKDALVIGVLGKNPFGKKLKELEGKTVKNRKVVISHCNDIDDANRFHLLFISNSMEGDVESVLKQLADSPVLTVSDIDKFADKGGMIQMFSVGGMIRFNINLESTNRSSITLSSNLLQLAQKVIGR